MDSSSNLNPLGENLPEEEPIEEAPASVFAARPLRPPSTSCSEKYSVVEWTNYFDKEDDISIPGSNDVFHVYMAGTEGPVVFCLHGGGYSGYEGLSEKFLSSPVPKLLLLAGIDRLDRTLTIGQMQGKFQMIVVKHIGHAIQEDVPEEFANLVLNFISRNRIGPHGVEIPGMWKPSQPKT